MFNKQYDKFNVRNVCLFLIAFVPVTKIFLLPSIMAQFAFSDMWISALLNVALDTLTLFCALSLWKRYEGRDFYNILADNFGKTAAKIVYALYFLYFILKAYSPVTEQKTYVERTLYESTATVFTFLPFFLVSAYLASKKLFVLGRLADVIPMLDSGLTPKDLLDQKYLSKDGQPNDSAVSMVTNMNQFLQQEIDRLSDENAQMDEQLAAVGASPVGDYMANAGVAAEDAAQNVVAAGVQELMTEEELPEIAMPEGLDDIDNQWEDEDFEELDAEVPQENAASLAEHTAEQTKPEALAEADDTMEAGTSAEDVEAAILAETARQMAKESVEKEELPEIELPGDLDLGKEETAEEILPAIAEPEAFEVPDTISKLSKELREIFTYFVPITGMEEQLCQALTGASQHLAKGMTAGTGNMIIQGGSGSGKTVLATSMIKALQKETGKPNGKIGKIEASVLNQKDVAALLKKVAGGCLIIEKAGDLSRETALKLSLLLEQDTSGVLVIIEDTKHGIQKALSRDDGFAAKFSEKINIPIFTSDELVSFAKSYANELGYTIDEMGVLALYNSISNIEHADRETTLTEVKEIVDKAVAHSEKGGLKKAFSIITSRRYDEDDYIILREKDFD